MKSMKWFIITSDAGKKIVPIQKYLLRKYARDARVIWLDLEDKPIKGWCKNLARLILDNDPSEHIVLMLDDHLLVDRVVRSISMPEGLERLELGERTRHHASCTNGDWLYLNFGNDTPYKVSTQPSIWNTEALIRVLLRVDGTPWDFEVKGICRAGIVKDPIVKVIPESALSRKWEGVNLRLMRQEDIDEILKRKYITRDDIRGDS